MVMGGVAHQQAGGGRGFPEKVHADIVHAKLPEEVGGRVDD
jgi:hypothetical protein